MPDLQLGRRMDFPAKATIFEEGEPKVAVYTLRRGIAVRPASEASLDDGVAMNWLSIETAPFDRDLELAVIDFDGVRPLMFACRRVLGG